MPALSPVHGRSGIACLWTCLACLSLGGMIGCAGHVESRTRDQSPGDVPPVATSETQDPKESSQADRPQPRWMCDETELTAEPAWPGEYVPFSFEVCNLGEDDMLIVLQRR